MILIYQKLKKNLTLRKNFEKCLQLFWLIFSNFQEHFVFIEKKCSLEDKVQFWREHIFNESHSWKSKGTFRRLWAL